MNCMHTVPGTGPCLMCAQGMMMPIFTPIMPMSMGPMCVHGFPAGQCILGACNMVAGFQMGQFRNFFASKCVPQLRNCSSSHEKKHVLQTVWNGIPDEFKQQAKAFMIQQVGNLASELF